MITDKFYIRGMNVRLPKDHNGYFFGKHSTGYGNVWEAVLGNTSELSFYIENCVQKGKVVSQTEIEDKKYSGIVFPENNSISTFSLIETNNNQNHFVSVYPMLMGVNNNLKLKESYSWGIKGEGEMAAETDLGKIINFHNPFFSIDNKDFKYDKVQTVSLSGLVLYINKMEIQEFPVEGDVYNLYLKEFLKDNPNKTEKDFNTPVHVVDAEHFRMFAPTDYCSEFEIATKIEDIKYVDFLDNRIAVMTVNLEHSDNNEYLYLNIYASANVLKDYKPKVGDGINAVVWMSGFFN